MQTLRKTNLFRLAFGTTTNVRLHKSTFTMLQNNFPFLDHPNGILFRINVEPPSLEPAVQWERRSRHKWIELEAQSANFNRYQLWSVPIGCTFLSAAPLFSLSLSLHIYSRLFCLCHFSSSFPADIIIISTTINTKNKWPLTGTVGAQCGPECRAERTATNNSR